MSFPGFPERALDFYEDLEVDNTKSFWQANKATYDECIAAPIKALTAELAPEFGQAKIFRPHRDMWLFQGTLYNTRTNMPLTCVNAC